MKHGDGGKWYLNARNYSKELREDNRIIEHLEAVYKTFEQTWSGKYMGVPIPGLGYKLKLPIIGRVVKALVHRTIYNENENRSDSFTDGHFGQVIPLHEAKMILGNLAQEPMLQSYCACRWGIRGRKEARCINFGPVSDVIEKIPRFAPDKERMRIDREQAIEAVEQFNKDGNILSVYFHPIPLVSTICACDAKECAGLTAREQLGLVALFKGEYVAIVDRDECQVCGACISKCQVGAIDYDEAQKEVLIDIHRCYGCGVCGDNCEHEAIKLIPRDDILEVKGHY